ncbi:MAG: carbohydrate ABC transporter permease [Thermaceae bacterium]|nr:carbohydrate ABC transporter permease [Thermaceae bacterium]
MQRTQFHPLTWLLALVWLVITLFPFWFMVSSSFKGPMESYTRPVWALPVKPSFNNYLSVLEGGFFHYVGNSVLVVSLSVGLILILSAMAAYVFARLPYRPVKPLFGLIVAGLAVPVHVTLIPVYTLTTKLGIYDTPWALIGPYVAFSLPLSIFILTEFVRQIPRELDDAARVDGCSPARTFFSIILPLTGPGMATMGIYNTVMLWNEFVFAYTLTSSPQQRTLPLAIWEFQGQYSANVPAIMAVLTLTALPMIMAYLFGQERIIRGMMAGALKG